MIIKVGFMSFHMRHKESVIYLLLYLSINICSTVPVYQSDLRYGTEKLTDGVPTPTHYSQNDNEMKITQPIPSSSSVMSLMFPEIHVTSEVRTASLQISNNGIPVIKRIVNPMVFARDPQHDILFEPTEMEAPISTSTSPINNSTNSDILVTTGSSVIHDKKLLNSKVEREKEIKFAGKINKRNQSVTVMNSENNLAEKGNINPHYGTKRISAPGEIRNQTQVELPTKNDSPIVSNAEVVPLYKLQGSDMQSEINGLHITKRQKNQSKTYFVPSPLREFVQDNITYNQTKGESDSESLKVKTLQQNITMNLTTNLSSLKIDHPLNWKESEGGLVAELKSSTTKMAQDSTYALSEIPILVESTKVDDLESAWKTDMKLKPRDPTENQRDLTISKINQDEISQLSHNSEDFANSNNRKTYSIKPKLIVDTTQIFSEGESSKEIVPKIKEKQLPFSDLIMASALDEQDPKTGLKSRGKVILQASEENVQTGIEKNDELTITNKSRANFSREAEHHFIKNKSGIQVSSSILQGVLKSRALDPYGDLYNSHPSRSPNEEILSPISEQIDSDLATGCITAIVLGVILCGIAAIGSLVFVVYNRHAGGIRPKILSSDGSCANSDSGGYFDDQCQVAYLNSQSDVSKGTPEDLVSLDNDSFLNSLESMTIQNLWTDSIRHTKL